MNSAEFKVWLTRTPRRTLVMGVLNVTPDSFSDGGLYLDRNQAADHARQMIEEGADLIDIGGESTRPGATRINADEQIRRVVPAIQAISKLGLAISIDTTLSKVAHAALDAGASIVNDISAGQEDREMASLCAQSKCPVVLMHMQGNPGTMQVNPTYSDVVAEVRDGLLARARHFESAGVSRGSILLDPGIGFGKTVEHNLQLLKHLPELVKAGYPILVGTSRKGFIGKVLNLPASSDRILGTAATIAWSVANGAGIVRVHDVSQMKQIVEMTRAILEVPGPDAR